MRKRLVAIYLLICLLYLTTGSGHAATHGAQGRPGVSVHSGYVPVRPSASVGSGDSGLGVMLGEPTGVVFKSWTSRTTAFDVGGAYLFNGFFTLLGDYLWHFPNLFSRAGRTLSEFVPYMGTGAEVFFETSSNHQLARAYSGRGDSNAGFAVRVPLGLEFLPRRTSIGFFGEFTPALVMAPSVFAVLEAGLGARYYF